ncbi:MAG TPA: glycosyltransferase family 87 protein [Candidatus Eisenbacteria bacterium]|jgi:glycosyl transferase family 87|nr:glycosyltransferase family 87 protein [Candidatus Eisenbacteria bacterium]
MHGNWRKVLMGVVITAIAAFFVIRHFDSVRQNVAQRDYIQYWAAGQFLIHGGDPYDAQRVLELEWEQGYAADRPVVVRTPPWSLFLFLPLGLVSAFWGWVLWMAASVAALMASVRLTWRIFGKAPESRSLCVVIGYTFAPVLGCLLAAQIGLLLLVGIVLFLVWEDKRPFLAGAALLLPFAKPHLLVFFWLAFLIWILVRQKFAVAGGFAAAVGAATMVAVIFDHTAFQHYFRFLRTAAIEGEFIPTVSGVLRLLLFRPYFRVQFVPMALGLIWSVCYCAKHRANWDWRDHGLAVMVVSILTTPYGWLTDEVVLMPAMVFAGLAIFGGQRKVQVTTRIALGIFALLNWILLMLLALHVPLQLGIYFWSSLLWFAWYVYGCFAMDARRKRELHPAVATS